MLTGCDTVVGMTLRLMIVESGWLMAGRGKAVLEYGHQRPNSTRFAHAMAKAEWLATVVRWTTYEEWVGGRRENDLRVGCRPAAAAGPLLPTQPPRSITIHSHRFPSIPSFFENKSFETRAMSTRGSHVRPPIHFGWIKVNQG